MFRSMVFSSSFKQRTATCMHIYMHSQHTGGKEINQTATFGVIFFTKLDVDTTLNKLQQCNNFFLATAKFFLHNYITSTR